jgi:dihydroflavonol-4-reductase
MHRKRVWVSGANGHLGYNLVRVLRDRGYDVRASVRDVHDATKVGPLTRLGVEPVQAELTDAASLARAAEGMDGVFHVAAVFDTAASDPKSTLDEPNVEGTRRVVEACANAGVGKLVLTSSIAAVGTAAKGERPRDERDWNERAIEPYARSKRDAERVAWERASARGLELVTILPGTMLGPGLFRHTPSTKIIESAVMGKLPIIPPFRFSYVDVRDVAEAHVLAYESPRAEGRYIASGETLSVGELLHALHRVDPAIVVPTATLPEPLLFLLPIFDWLEHRFTGAPRQITRALIDEYGGRVQSVSSARLRDELSWKPRPFSETLAETLQWMAETEGLSSRKPVQRLAAGR